MNKFTLILFTILMNISTSAAFISSNCEEKEDSIALQFEEAETSFRDMLRDVESIIEFGNLESFERKRFRQAQRVIKCSLFRIKTTRFSCTSRNDDAIAFTIKWIGISVWATDSYFNYPHDEQVGFLIHEVTHKCGTNDADYFWTKSPRDVNQKKWSSIADTYRWWHHNGVCNPGVDCD